MSLGKLLKAGKSLIGGQDGARYQMNPRKLLPKFSSPKNPFAVTPNREGVATQTVTPVTPANSLSPQAADTEARAVSAQTKTKTDTARVPACIKAWRWLADQRKKLDPITGLMRVQSAGKSAIPRFNAPPVQGELHLEKVKVMRNDLSDSDMEVVPAADSAKASPGRVVWGQLTTRVFGAKPT